MWHYLAIPSDTGKTALILSGFAVAEAHGYSKRGCQPAWIFPLLRVSQQPLRAAGLDAGFGCRCRFTAVGSRLPSVRANLFRFSWLKVLALAMALAAGFCEEAVFRKLLMDAMAHRDYTILAQVLASALSFGAVHGIWGAFRGSPWAAISAIVATSVLGFALAVVYVASHRLLAPCVMAHVLINALCEPGLVLAAIRGEMGTSRIQAAL